jgi:HEAT repeat protein
MPGDEGRELAAALVDPRGDVRRRALWLVPGGVADPELGVALLGALADPVWCVREAAALAAGRLSDPDGAFLGALVGLALHDPSPFVRVAAAEAVGPRVVPRRDYGAAATHRFERQRVRAAAALGRVRRESEGESVELLVSCVGDSHPKVRLEALRSLARLNPDALLPATAVVVRKCAEADAKIAAAARSAWERLLAAPAAHPLRPLRTFPGTDDVPGVRLMLGRLEPDRPLRRAAELRPLPDGRRDAARLARHLAALCGAVLTGAGIALAE